MIYNRSRCKCLTYGVAGLLGKVFVFFLLLSTPSFAQGVTVLALGDSLTQGYGLREDDGFVPQLQSWITDQGVDATLINGGVSGDTTAGGAARVEWSLSPDVSAMIVALGGNDLLRGIDPDVSRTHLETILKVANDQGIKVLLVGMEAPNNYGEAYKTKFDTMYPDLARDYATLLFPSFFEGLGSRDPAAIQGFFQRDGIHPNADGVAKIVEAIGPSVLQLIAAAK